MANRPIPTTEPATQTVITGRRPKRSLRARSKVRRRTGRGHRCDSKPTVLPLPRNPPAGTGATAEKCSRWSIVEQRQKRAQQRGNAGALQGGRRARRLTFPQARWHGSASNRIGRCPCCGRSMPMPSKAGAGSLFREQVQAWAALPGCLECWIAPCWRGQVGSVATTRRLRSAIHRIVCRCCTAVVQQPVRAMPAPCSNALSWTRCRGCSSANGSQLEPPLLSAAAGALWPERITIGGVASSVIEWINPAPPLKICQLSRTAAVHHRLGLDDARPRLLTCPANHRYTAAFQRRASARGRAVQCFKGLALPVVDVAPFGIGGMAAVISGCRIRRSACRCAPRRDAGAADGRSVPPSTFTVSSSVSPASFRASRPGFPWVDARIRSPAGAGLDAESRAVPGRRPAAACPPRGR